MSVEDLASSDKSPFMTYGGEDDETSRWSGIYGGDCGYFGGLWKMFGGQDATGGSEAATWSGIYGGAMTAGNWFVVVGIMLLIYYFYIEPMFASPKIVVPATPSPAVAAAPANSAIKHGRYVRIERVKANDPAVGNYINIAEIIVKGPGNQVWTTAQTKVTSGSMWNAQSNPASMIVDNDPETWTATDNLADFTKVWLEVDLGVNRPIESVTIVNRKDVAWHAYKRIQGTQVIVKNDNGEIVFAGPEIQHKPETDLQYVFPL